MLTYPETVTAIRSLQTTPDILRRACREVIQEETPPDQPTHVTRSLKILDVFQNDPPKLVLYTLCFTLARVASKMGKISEAENLRKTLIACFNSEYVDSIAIIVQQELETNPENAGEELVKLISSIAPNATI